MKSARAAEEIAVTLANVATAKTRLYDLGSPNDRTAAASVRLRIPSSLISWKELGRMAIAPANTAPGTTNHFDFDFVMLSPLKRGLPQQ
jgi:hypothetical protein